MLLHMLQQTKLAHYKECHFYLAVYPKIQNACAYVHVGITKMNKQRFAKIVIDLRRARSTLEESFADSFIYVVVIFFYQYYNYNYFVYISVNFCFFFVSNSLGTLPYLKTKEKQKLTEIKKKKKETAAYMFPDSSIWIRKRHLLKSVNSRSFIQLQTTFEPLLTGSSPQQPLFGGQSMH